MPKLYGLKNLNKDLNLKDSWGKNQFNNLFPAALMCFMRDQGLPFPYIVVDNHKNKILMMTGSELVGSELGNDDLFFEFEGKYEPFQDFVSDKLENIDLIIRENSSKRPIRPLEIKLTTLPDNTTCDLGASDYGSELVVRDKTTRYIAMSIAQSCVADFDDIEKILEPTCGYIRDWENKAEMLGVFEELREKLDLIVAKYSEKQRPILVQPIWKTDGKTSRLSENCLDVFVWSDFALVKMLLDLGGKTSKGLGRPQRAILRMARFLYEVASKGRVFQAPIYDGMTFDTLNDKEFAFTGRQTHKYMSHNRLTTPALKKSVISDIVLDGGEEFLSPERRFDAVIYYTLGSSKF